MSARKPRILIYPALQFLLQPIYPEILKHLDERRSMERVIDHAEEMAFAGAVRRAETRDGPL
jgi:hypothetical protein